MDIISDMEELGFENQIEEFTTYFNKNFSYIYQISISDKQISSFLKRPEIRRLSLEDKANLFCDWIMSQNLCDYVE